MVGVNSQREIEHAVAKAIAAHAISGTESFPARVTLEVAGLKLNVNFDGEIDPAMTAPSRTACPANLLIDPTRRGSQHAMSGVSRSESEDRHHGAGGSDRFRAHVRSR
jgi:hypothetical protein